eukprot:COSAG04_NODE_6_length_47123_cov_87.347482_20_plen_422_part_00
MFGMPLDKAAAQMGMGRTLFKKVCRREGIERWPYGYGYNNSQQAGAEGSRSHKVQREWEQQHEQQADELEDEVEWPQGLEVDFDQSDGWRPPPITEAAAAPAGPPPQSRPEPRPKPKPKATRQPRRVRPQDECEQCMPGSGKRRGHVGRHTTNPLGGRSRGRAPYGFNVTKRPAAAVEKAEAPSEDDQCPACMRYAQGFRPNRAHTCDKAGRYQRKAHPRSQPAIAAVRNVPRAEPDAEDSAAPAGQEAAADTHEVYELDDQIPYDIEPELPAAAGTGRGTSSRSPSVSPSVSTSSSPSSSPGPPQKKRAPVPKKAWEEEEIGESSEGRGAGGFRKKMAWSPAEDEQLLALVAQHGPQKWSVIAEHVRSSRTITISILGCPALRFCAPADAEEGGEAVPRAVAEPAPPHHQQGPTPPLLPF